MIQQRRSRGRGCWAGPCSFITGGGGMAVAGDPSFATCGMCGAPGLGGAIISPPTTSSYEGGGPFPSSSRRSSLISAARLCSRRRVIARERCLSPLAAIASISQSASTGSSCVGVRSCSCVILAGNDAVAGGDAAAVGGQRCGSDGVSSAADSPISPIAYARNISPPSLGPQPEWFQAMSIRDANGPIGSN